jgi:hypothetical protein
VVQQSCDAVPNASAGRRRRRGARISDRTGVVPLFIEEVVEIANVDGLAEPSDAANDRK